MSLDLVLLEDNADHAELLVRELQNAGLEFSWVRVDTEAGFYEALKKHPDVILSDYEIPPFDAIRALEIRNDGFGDIPMIIVTGKVGEERAVECIKSGATDFLLKVNLTRLPHAIERALSERRLKAMMLVAEAKYRDLVETVPAIVYAAEPGAQGAWSYVSPQVEMMLGYEPQEWISSPQAWLSAIHPDDLEHVLAAEAEVQKSGTGVTSEYRMFARTGELVWVRDQSSLVIVHGAPILTGFIFDITEQKLAEMALVSSERRYRTVFDGAGLGISTADLDGTITSANQGLADMLGYDTDELVGLNFAAITHPDDVSKGVELYNAVESSGSYRLEKRYIRKSGETIWGSLIVTLIEAGDDDPAFCVGTIEDITSQKESLLAQERLVAVLEATTDLVVMAGVDEELLYINPAGRLMLEIPLDEDVTQLSLSAIRPPDGYRFAIGTARPVAARAGSWSGEGDFLTRSGRVVPMSMVLVAHKGLDGTEELYSTIARDLSQQRKLEAQLLQSQKMEAIGSLAGGVAHDFNNLLSVILNYADFVLDALDVSDPRYEDVREIEKAGERGAKLVQQLLSFSRQEVVRPEVLSLDDLVAGMERLLKPTIGEDVKLEVRALPDAWMTRMDPSQMEQIVMNLAVNARDAMPTGGKLTLKISNVRVDDTDAVSDLSPGAYVCLTVTDTGRGMDEDLKQRVFEPFFTTKPRGSGTGLGLATVYGIVQQAGGHIRVHSRPEQGSSFQIYLPAVEAPVDDPPVVEVEEALVGGARTVLLVESDDAVRRMVTRMLDANGFEVLATSSGSEGLGVAETWDTPIDLLVTDVAMSEMSNDVLSDRPVSTRNGFQTVFMSGETNGSSQQTLLENGEVRIQKPFSERELLSKIDEALAV